MAEAIGFESHRKGLRRWGGYQVIALITYE